MFTPEFAGVECYRCLSGCLLQWKADVDCTVQPVAACSICLPTATVVVVWKRERRIGRWWKVQISGPLAPNTPRSLQSAQPPVLLASVPQIRSLAGFSFSSTSPTPQRMATLTSMAATMVRRQPTYDVRRPPLGPVLEPELCISP